MQAFSSVKIAQAQKSMFKCTSTGKQCCSLVMRTEWGSWCFLELLDLSDTFQTNGQHTRLQAIKLRILVLTFRIAFFHSWDSSLNFGRQGQMKEPSARVTCPSFGVLLVLTVHMHLPSNRLLLHGTQMYNYIMWLPVESKYNCITWGKSSRDPGLPSQCPRQSQCRNGDTWRAPRLPVLLFNRDCEEAGM